MANANQCNCTDASHHTPDCCQLCPTYTITGKVNLTVYSNCMETNQFIMLTRTVKIYIKTKNLFLFTSLSKLDETSVVDCSVMIRTLDRKKSKKQHGQSYFDD